MLSQMDIQSNTVQRSAARKGYFRSGWIITGLVALFLLFDGIMKLVKPAPVVQAFARTGWPVELSAPIGIILLSCTVVYLVPRLSLLGAILLTGYLGGAVATNLRLENPLFSNTLFPVYFGILMWVSVWLREPRLRNVFPVLK